MSEKLKLFKQEIKNKKITVLGIGVSNLPLIEFLAKNGAIVTACDKRTKDDLSSEMNRLSPYDIKYNLGEGYLDNIDADIVFKTPGMRFDLPELIKAKNNGSIITSEMEVFFELCDAKKIAITGSDGKTTTTTLIAKMLEKQGHNVWIGGNIGNPLLDKIEDIRKNDYVVLELSSFQLHTMTKSPDIAVITNISPNHLDMHKDMNEYVDAKKNIFKYQKSGNRLVLNFDNEITRSFEKETVNAPIFFTRKSNKKDGVHLKNDTIFYDDKKVFSINEIKIPGVHNIENYMAAIAALWGIVDIDNMRFIAQNFGGVEHRIELVREIDGVKYYNDSIASSPTRTTAGLLSFDKKVILIAGGYDKNIPFDDFGSVLAQHVKKLFLIGVTAPKIKAAANSAGLFDIVMCDSLEQAVSLSHEAAKNGDVVLLSPACASFDMFKNFAVRGNLFKKLVNEL